MAHSTRDLNLLLQTLEPTLNFGVYVYCSVPFNASLGKIVPLATFREVEGLTVVLEESVAMDANFKVLFRAAWITLTVQSDLQAVGLTAAFANALSAAGISCNVIAAAFHDHIFVPIEDARAAMAVLIKLQQDALSAK
jgi:uncharacterized protein